MLKKSVDGEAGLKYNRPKFIIRRSDHAELVECPDCGTLLYKVLFKSEGTVIEIKCRKCGLVYRSM